ncbi:MAG: ABC transporter permease [Clostridia bacterium]|nr:ABC transporter permease [Clostridia bacterium]
MENTVSFEKNSFGKRLKSMIRVDLSRMFKSKLFYILIATALLIPVLITVMMTMMDGTVSKDPQTGVETVMEGPDNAWQSIGTLPTEGDESSEAPSDGAGAMGAMGGMDVMSMCNINMMFMLVAVFICLFISEDFRSGYSKNLFTVRADRGEYVISKTLAGFLAGTFMLLAYFIGAMLGGAISSLSFDLGSLSILNVVMCMVAKIFLMLVFVSIDVIVSVAAKQMAWLSLCGSLGAGMLLFMMVSMITPLSSTIINVVLCIAGGAMFGFGLGIGSRAILRKTSLV